MRSSRAATFLRKGSGLRRYNGAGSPPKAFKRSQSQGNCAAAVTPTVNGSKVRKTTLAGDIVEYSAREAMIQVSGSLSCLQSKLKSSTSCSKLDAPLAKKSPVVKKSVLRAPTATGKGQEPGSGGNVRSGRPGKPAPKNRLVVPKSKAIAIKKISASSAAKDGGGCVDEDASPVYDSVEWSFREKLKKAEKKHKVSAGALERRLGKSNTAPSPFVERAGGACGVRDAGGGGR